MFTINTYGKSLKTNGSNWLVTKYNTYVENRGDLPIFLNSYSEGEKLHISKSNDQWLIQMDSTENQGCYCNLYIKSLSNEGVLLFSENYYTLSGNGMYIYNQNGLIKLKFDITETISRKWVSEFYFHEGAVEFEAQKSNHENIPIKAEYLDKEHFRLTYRNITEVWEFWETSYSYQDHVLNNANALLRDYTLLEKSYKRFLLCKMIVIHHPEELLHCARTARSCHSAWWWHSEPHFFQNRRCRNRMR